MDFSKYAGMNMVYRFFPFSGFLEMQREMGVTNIEFWAGYPHFAVESAKTEDIKKLRSDIKQYGLKTVAVTIPSLGYQYQYCPSSRDAYRKCRDYFLKGMQLAAELGAGIMTVNSGWSYFDRNREDGFSKAGAFLHEMCIYAEKMGIKLALESLTPMESNIATDLSSTRHLLDIVNHRNLGLTIDTGACACVGETSRMWFEKFGEKIIHAHFIDGASDSVGHFVWGDGTLNLKSEIKAYEEYHYEGYFSSELASGLYGSNPADADRRNIKRIKHALTSIDAEICF